jgi:hypothetical protein
MDKTKLAENLSGLVNLAEHNGVDVRPTLLRVLTDLYLQKGRHTEQEERQYSELALRLIDVVDMPTRASIAVKLAPYPGTPKAVIRRLSRDVLAVAAPVLRRSTALSDAELYAIAVELGQGYAAVIATRDGGDATAATPATLPAADPQRLRTSLAGTTTARELSELFFFSSSAERRLILLNLQYAAAKPGALVMTANAAAIDRLEMAALARLPDQFAGELAQIIDISREQALRLARDESGEPVVVAAKALGVPAAVMQRILLFLNPAIGESVTRVFDLASLFEEISREAAEAMVSIWREARAMPARAAAHLPLHYDDEVGRATATAMRPQAMPQPAARRSA